MKYIPNTITMIRIVLSILLFFIKPLTLIFIIIYSFSGISDMIDGFIARKTNTTSNLGAILDSIADIVFIGVVILVLFPVIIIPHTFLIWILLIALIRLISLLIGFFKFHSFVTLHTYTNKATGLCLFTFPYLYGNINIFIVGSVICFIASLAAMEELLIITISKEVLRDITWIFAKTNKE